MIYHFDEFISARGGNIRDSAGEMSWGAAYACVWYTRKLHKYLLDETSLKVFSEHGQLSTASMEKFLFGASIPWKTPK